MIELVNDDDRILFVSDEIQLINNFYNGKKMYVENRFGVFSSTLGVGYQNSHQQERVFEGKRVYEAEKISKQDLSLVIAVLISAGFATPILIRAERVLRGL